MTLTEMLREAIGTPQSKAEAEAIEAEIIRIKEAFREWLQQVGLGEMTYRTKYTVESTRQLLVTLVDEP